MDDGVAEIDGDGDAQAFDAARAEAGLPAFLAREAEGVARVVAGGDVVPAGGVAGAAGDGALDGGELADTGAGAARDAPERAFHADQAGVRSRDADAAAAVPGRGGGDESACYRCCRAAGGAGGRALEVPRVAGHAVQLRGGVSDEAELGGGGLADEDGACSAEAGDVGGVVVGDVVLEDERAVGRGPAGRVLDVLHENRDAGEEAGVLAVLDALVDLRRLLARAFCVEHRERVELRVGDRFEGCLDGVGGLHFAVPDRVGQG